MILSRLCIGHMHIFRSHLLKKEDPLIYSTCKVPLTVKHILINCDRFRQIHPKYYQTNNLDLFKHQTRGYLELSKRNQPLHQNLTKYNKHNKNLYLNPKTCTKDKINITLLALNDPQGLICH